MDEHASCQRRLDPNKAGLSYGKYTLLLLTLHHSREKELIWQTQRAQLATSIDLVCTRARHQRARGASASKFSNSTTVRKFEIVIYCMDASCSFPFPLPPHYALLVMTVVANNTRPCPHDTQCKNPQHLGSFRFQVEKSRFRWLADNHYTKITVVCPSVRPGGHRKPIDPNAKSFASLQNRSLTLRLMAH